jgi:hypothetical protein
MASAKREPLMGFLAIAEDGETVGHISTVVVSDFLFRPLLPSIPSPSSPLSVLTLGDTDAIYGLLLPPTFVSIEPVELDVSRCLRRSLVIGSGE